MFRGRRSSGTPNDREQRVIELVAQGLKNKEVADEIGTTEHVVKNYLRKVYDKLGVADRLELALYCLNHRVVENEKKAAEDAANGHSNGAASADGQAMAATPNKIS